MTELDARLLQQAAEMQAVYRMFDAEGGLLYIGVTGDLSRRISVHAEKRWFLLVETIRLEWHPTQAAAWAAEQRAIREEQPRINITGKQLPPTPIKRKPKRLRAVPPPTGPLTIKQAVAEGISGPSADAVYRAWLRSPSRPKPIARDGNAHVFDRIEWCDWEEARRQPRRLVR